MKGRVNKEGFEISQLQVLEDADRTVIHRDYLAHVFRWQYVVKWLAKGKRYETTRVLDVGCGYDIPLYVCLHANRRIPLHYTGVDVNNIREPQRKYRGDRTLLHHTPIHKVFKGDYDLITCFEMLEHVPNDYARQTLKHCYDISNDNATMITSTPVFDEKVGAASNHINEMTREEMISAIEDAGWEIEANYGTFASQKDYKKNLTETELDLFNRLNEYYHSDIVATIFDPLYPEYSRNNIWILTK